MGVLVKILIIWKIHSQIMYQSKIMCVHVNDNGISNCIEYVENASSLTNGAGAVVMWQ